MAIRPVMHGPLADDVTGRIVTGYLYVTVLSAVSPAKFEGGDPGALALPVYNNLGGLGSGYASIIPYATRPTGFDGGDPGALALPVYNNFGGLGSGYAGIIPYVTGPSRFNGGDAGVGRRIVADPERLFAKIPYGYLALVSDLASQTVSSDLSLTGTVEFIKAIPREITQTLTFADTVELETGKYDTIVLTQTLGLNIVKEIQLEDSLTLVHDLIPGENIPKSVSNDLTLGQSVSFKQAFALSVSNDLILAHAIEPELRTGNAVYTESGYWICPPGIASVEVRVWGGGGGGGGRLSNVPGGGGGGGGYSTAIVPVTEGAAYTIVVGAGGAGATGNAADGGDSYFNTTITALAKGGKGGTGGYYFDDGDSAFPAYGAGGAGGLATSGVGTTRYKGGVGASGLLVGKGGSSAGTFANGVDGNPGTPVPDNAGPGGSQAAGTAPGGGGGGQYATNSAGYAGAAGKVVLMYVLPHQKSHSLALSQTLVASREITKSLSDTLALSAVLTRDESSIFKYHNIGVSDAFVVNVIKSIVFSDTLALEGTDVIPGARTFFDKTDSIGVAHTLATQAIYDRPFADSLTLSHEMVGNVIRSFSFTDGLILSSGNVERNLAYQRIFQEIALLQSAGSRILPKITESQSLALQQILGYSPRYEVLSDILAFTQTVYHNLVQTGFFDTLDLSQEVIANVERVFAFSDTLDFTGEAYKTAAEGVAHSLSLSHSLEKIDVIQSTLSLSHSITLDKGKLLTQLLSLSHTVQVGLVLERSLTHSLTLGQSAVGIVNQHDTCTYNPISTVLAGAPTLVKAATVTYTCGAASITLRAPAIGDTDEMTFQKVFRETSGGTLKGYRQSTWPKARTLEYKFDNLDNTCSDDYALIQAFLKASLGLQVTLVDYWGRTWVGVITNPDATYEEQSRTTRTITIKFQGVLQ